MGKTGKINASLTVEAAFVIPLSFYALLYILYLFIWLRTEYTVYEGMLKAGDMLSAYGTAGAYFEKSGFMTDIFEAGGSDVNDEAEALSAELISFVSGVSSGYYSGTLIRSALSGKEALLSCIQGGMDGIDCSLSRVYGGNAGITLKVSYTLCMPFDFFGIGERNVVQSIKTAGFYGTDWEKTAEFDDDRKRREDDAHPAEEYVYCTRYGTVYHKDLECTYINIRVESISRNELGTKRNLDGHIYYPCSRCAAEGAAPTVYITAYGTRYHNDRNCSDIERDPDRITMTAAENAGLRPCSKCGY